MPSPRETLQSFSAVVITGGSSGIGKSFIQLGSKLNPQLVFCNLSRSNPSEKNPYLPKENLNHFACDLSRPGEVDRAADQVLAFLHARVPAGRILLINNSGSGTFGRFSESEHAVQLELIDLNVRAMVALTARFLPLLQARGGAILNVASTVAFLPTPFAATYGATKAFVLHWSLALREELRGSSVAVSTLCPGTTSTNFFARAGVALTAVHLRRGMSADRVAEYGFRLVSRNAGLGTPGLMNCLLTTVVARIPKQWAARLAAPVFARRKRDPRRPS